LPGYTIEHDETVAASIERYAEWVRARLAGGQNS
jgi:hypothetical protein